MPYPDALRGQIEAYLENLRFSQEPLADRLVESMRYSLLAGGKRIRPVLARWRRRERSAATSASCCRSRRRSS